MQYCSSVQVYVFYRGFIELQQTYGATIKIFQGHFVNFNHAFIRMCEVMGLHFEFQNQNQKFTGDTSKRQSFIEELVPSSHQGGESSAPSTEERVHSRGKKLHL